MADFTGIKVSTIKPAGGGDYTTLALWWAAEKSNGQTQCPQAECYLDDGVVPSGLGALTITSADLSYTTTSEYYVRIYAADANDGLKHTPLGEPPDFPTGAWLDPGDSTGIFVNGVHYTRVEGIYFNTTFDHTGVLFFNADNCVAKYNTFSSNFNGNFSCINVLTSSGCIIASNTIYINPSGTTGKGISFNGSNDNCTIVNNTVTGGSGTFSAGDYGIFMVNSGGTCAIGLYNNVVFECVLQNYYNNGCTLTSVNNVSDDATLSGTGDVTNANPTQYVTGTDTDHRPTNATPSYLKNMDGTPLWSIIPFDCAGKPRPNTDRFTRGAHTAWTPPTKHKLYYDNLRR